MREQALSLLRTALDNPNATFRDGQWEAIEEIVQNRSRLLVVQRTGWGKSFVYFVATRLIRERGKGTTLLVSPLLALMRNQIAAARRIDVKAATINSTNNEDWTRITKELLAGSVDLLLISPERLGNQEFREKVLGPIASSVGLFVVDEAHCISDWGHDFRPDYRRIVRVLQFLPPNLPVLATTATANDRVVEDIQNQLGDNLRVVRGQLTRESLQLQNISLPSPAARLAWLAHTLPCLPGSGIIYTLTVRDAEIVARWLIGRSINAKPYHSESENREELEDRLLNNQIKVLVATTALGMGFDKPDLGFVIHYQRPASVVHYYQQVGRAGRAVDRAYGILLSGQEDDEIADYFREAAFPPGIHTEQVLAVLNSAKDGLSILEIERAINLSRGKIEKVLKLLSLESPSPVTKQSSKWFATAAEYHPDTEKIERLKEIRRREQAQMREYMESQSCLMEFLARALDDPDPTPCGQCAVCVSQPLLSPTYSEEMFQLAREFLLTSDQIIEPRKKWPSRALSGFSGNIRADHLAERGRALGLWGSTGWGYLVKKGKYEDNHFDDRLIEGCLQTIRRWNPEPYPTWVTCVPSLARPDLVPDFAERLANRLNLPFQPAVGKIRQNSPQKEMQNGYQQVNNLDGVFSIDPDLVQRGPVFLIDDVVDSRWTLTAIAALLRRAGSGQVFPLTLAMNSPGES